MRRALSLSPPSFSDKKTLERIYRNRVVSTDASTGKPSLIQSFYIKDINRADNDIFDNKNH